MTEEKRTDQKEAGRKAGQIGKRIERDGLLLESIRKEQEETAEKRQALEAELAELAFEDRRKPSKARQGRMRKLEEEIEALARRGSHLQGEEKEALRVIKEQEEELGLLELDLRAARLHEVMGLRVQAAARCDEAMDALLAPLKELDGLISEASGAAMELSVRETDQRILERGKHVSEWLRWRLERFLGGKAERSNHAFRQPIAEVEADFQDLAQRSAGSERKKAEAGLRGRKGPRQKGATGPTAPSETDPGAAPPT